jgi:exopolyphosphatase/guanosine-5'-triphosphate,3'-diphosphate pyrophosphatase
MQRSPDDPVDISRFAAIDIGTNTASLVVAEYTDDRVRREHIDEQFVRLGEGVDARGRISTEAQERLLVALREQMTTARSLGAEFIVVGATSAMRDASNREDVQGRVRDELGLSIDLLSGAQESRWSFAAACAPFDDLAGDCLVIDVGGGSTELILGTASAEQTHARPSIAEWTSLDVGCVRLTERYFPDHPPPRSAVEKVEATVDAALSGAELSVSPGTPFIGTAGTATALALVHAGPDSTLDALTCAPVLLPAAEVRDWRTRLLAMTVDEIRTLHPDAMPGRADVFSVGVMLLDGVMTHFDLDALRVSPFELRYGLALRVLAEQTKAS